MISTDEIRAEVLRLREKRDALDQEIDAFARLLALRSPSIPVPTEPVRPRVRRVIRDNPKPLNAAMAPARSEQPMKRASASQSLQYAELAREWLNGFTGKRLTVRNFRSWIEEKFPDAEINKGSMSTPLRKLAEDGELIVIKEGKGRAPTIYEVAKPRLAMD